MINAVGREIPDEILQKMKKPAFTGAYSPKKDVIIRTTAKSRCAAIEKGKTAESKLLVSIEDVIEKTGIKDGMTISFHHQKGLRIYILRHRDCFNVMSHW